MRGGGIDRRRRCGEEAQAARCYCGRDGRRAGVEEAGASHPSSVGSGSKVGS